MKNVEKAKTKALIVYSLMNEYTLEKKRFIELFICLFDHDQLLFEELNRRPTYVYV